MFGKKAQAFVNIMKGCDKYCTYCIVPFTRGKKVEIQEVLDDVAQVGKNGVREVTLLGQNVNSFGKGNEDLLRREPRKLTSPIGRVGPALGEEISPAPARDGKGRAPGGVAACALHLEPSIGFQRRAFGLLPHHFPFGLTPASAGAERLGCRASTLWAGIIKSKPICGKWSVSAISSPRSGCRPISLSVFPAETDEDFQATLRMLDRLQLDNVYAFAYSSRPGTRAEKLADDVSKSEKNRRLNVLLKHQLRVPSGGTPQVEPDYGNPGRGPARHDYLLRDRAGVGTVYMGRTTCNRVVNLVSESPRDLTGQFVLVKLWIQPTSLQGEVVH